MSEEQYCLCCGEDVPTNKVYRDGNTEITCLYCSFVLGIQDKQKGATAQCILTADDSNLIRNLMTQILIKKGLAKEVLAFEDGMVFLSEFQKRLAAKQEVSLAILDLQMPVMDGLKAAMTMRALEKKANLAKKTQIIFFSARKCDDSLKKQLSQCTPAVYFNKGEAPDPAGLADRIDRLVSYILSQKKEKT
jgi:CheY-like chemotaxis protein